MTEDTIHVLTCQLSDVTGRYVCTGLRKANGTEYLSLFESSIELRLNEPVHEDDVSEQSVSLNDPSKKDTVVVWECMSHALLGYLLSRIENDVPTRALVLGLGNATVPRFIHAMEPDAHVLAMELDPVIVNVAREQFGFNGDVVIGDAIQGIKNLKDDYTLIFVDCFVGDEDLSMDPGMASEDFVAALDDRLAPDGILVVNQGSTESRRDMKLARRLMSHLKYLGYPPSLVVTAAEDSDIANQIMIVSRDRLGPGKLVRKLSREFSSNHLAIPILFEMFNANIKEATA